MMKGRFVSRFHLLSVLTDKLRNIPAFVMAFGCGLCLGWINLSLAQDSRGPSLTDSTNALEVREGYSIEVIASEPLIVDPVSIRFDYRGRLWVVEMPDYPLGPPNGGPPNGRIKILTDEDGDGRMDKSIVFVDRLTFATGVQPFRNGAFVTLAGSIVYLDDTDADGKADKTEVLFQGFAEQNQQLRANHPTLGPDGMIYVAGGLRGGKVQSVSERYAKKDTPIDLRDRDFCFDPNGGHWYAVAGKSQHGQSIDDFGRRTGCSNRNPAIIAPLTLDEIARDPLLVPRDALHDVAAAADKSRVVPIAKAWTTSNLHGGQFSAACGVLASGLFNEDGDEWSLTCEPTGYLVQRQIWSRSGSVWTSVREPNESEFVASRSTWFRPVDAVAGPAESVYLVDMARAVIEHPDFMPAELKQRPDSRYGTHLGRVWRVFRTDENKERKTQKIESPADAIRWLQSSHPWQREMATQYLLEHDPVNSQEPLRDLIHHDPSPAAVARAAQLLKSIDRLKSMDYDKMLGSSSARVCALAMRLAPTDDSFLTQVLKMATHQDEIVRRRVALTLVNAQQIDNAVLNDLLDADCDHWTQLTIGSARDSVIPQLASVAVTNEKVDTDLATHLIRRLAMKDASGAAKALCDGDSADSGRIHPRTLALLSAWTRGIKQRRLGVTKTLDQLPEKTQAHMQRLIDGVAELALDRKQSATDRAMCVSLCADFGRVTADFRKLLLKDQPPVVRQSVVAVLMRSDPEWTRSYLVENLGAMTAGLRAASIRAATSGTANTRWILNEINANHISKRFVDPATAKRLRSHPDKEVKQLAQKLFQPDANRVAVINKYTVAANELGEPKLGQKLFVEHCSACHRIDNVGTNVGPDISDSRTKTPEYLLTSILDPNAAIDASFVQYNVLTDDGQVISGLLVGETGESITLAKKGGDKVTVSRDSIERFETPGVSLMPEGFEQNIDVESMSHLLSYLKSWRYLKTEVPGAIDSLRQGSN